MDGDLAGPRGGHRQAAVTREQASSGGGGWAAGAARVAGLCWVGVQAGPACSAGSRLRSHWAFWPPEGVAWEPGGLQREKRETHTEGQPPGVIFPGFPPEAPSTRASFSPSTISRGKHPLPPKTFQTAVSVESPSRP